MISPVVNLFNIPCYAAFGMPVLFTVSIISLIVTVIVIHGSGLPMGGALDASDVGTSCHNSVLHTCGLHTGLFGQRQAGYEQGRKTGRCIGQHNGPYQLWYFWPGAGNVSAYTFLGAPGWAYSKGVAALYVVVYLRFITYSAMPYFTESKQGCRQIRLQDPGRGHRSQI